MIREMKGGKVNGGCSDSKGEQRERPPHCGDDQGVGEREMRTRQGKKKKKKGEPDEPNEGMAVWVGVVVLCAQTGV